MKKKMFGLIAGLSLIASPVMAEGYADVSFVGNSSASVGEIINVDVMVDNVSDTYEDKGVVSFGGYITFDENYLECVDYTYENDFLFASNNKTYKFGGVDLTLNNGVKSETKMLSFRFKTLKEGNTSITLKDAELTDTRSEVEANINSLNLTIANPVNEEVVEKVKETTTAFTNKTVEVKTDDVKTTSTTTNKIVEIKNEAEKTTSLIKTTKEQTTTTALEKKEKVETKKQKVSIFTKIINFIKKLFKK